MAALGITILVCFLTSVIAQSTTTRLLNGQTVTSSIAPGAYNYYYFLSPATTFGKRAISTLYLSSTTCSQPQPPPSFHDTIPSPDIFISTSKENTLPGPDNGIAVKDAIHGLTTWESDGTVSEIWIAVGATSLPTTWAGNWTYEIGVSISRKCIKAKTSFFFLDLTGSLETLHPVYSRENNDSTYLMMDDTDRTHALFQSNPFSGSPPNVTLLMTPVLPTELSYSLCAAKLNTLPQYSVNTTMTTRGYVNQTKYQFMVSNLTQATTYQAYLVQNNAITAPITLSTKMDANCRIIYDLPFCDQVAYSVPTNPTTFATDNMWDIAHLYDTQAQSKFDAFGTALSQFNCETTQYSLVRNCSDCYRDYKTWLCSVAIPRCTDSSISADLNQGTDKVPTAPAIRDISVNASRNAWVDEAIQPGEWTELLPCIDLCYHVVQSCPPFLQFFCPDGDLATVQYGYWQNGSATVNGSVYQFDINHPTCNRVGVDPALLTLSHASHLYVSSWFCVSLLVSIMLL